MYFRSIYVLIFCFFIITFTACGSNIDNALIGEWRLENIGVIGYTFYKDGTFTADSLDNRKGYYSTNAGKLTLEINGITDTISYKVQ